MKKQLKAVISMLLALVLFVSAIPIGAVTASAAAKLTSKVTYENDGTAIVTLTAGDFYNTVRYTLDGTVPTEDSKLYVMPIEITEKTLVRAAEFDGDKKIKGIKITATPKINENLNLKTGKISFETTQLGGKALVELSCETPDVEIRYTTDGTKPDENSELYENGIVIVGSTKIRARAYRYGYKTTTTYTRTIKVLSESDVEVSKEKEDAQEDTEEKEKSSVGNATSVENDAEKAEEKDEVTVEEKPKVTEKVYDNQEIGYKIRYNEGKSYVTLTPAKTGYTIRYTTDGSVPSKNSKKYSSRVGFEESGTLRARQYNSKNQCVGTLKINVKVKCADVKLKCIDMSTGIRTVEMSCETPGATIYYTIDSSSPKGEYALIYSEPIVVADITDINAYAAKEGYKDGNVIWEIAGRLTFEAEPVDLSDPVYQEGADIINAFRRNNNVPVIPFSEELTQAACLRARELSVKKNSHTRPNGQRYTSAISACGVDFNFSMEYFASGYPTVEDFINSVISNKENREKILNDDYDYNEIGIGYYKHRGVTHWVLLITD
ncbi:MAG: chitobiase/beta-hexosaminidase C-terminal domain-containing protein [Ruminiclostridium sp.]|nr:chitobiase/beta-hexosaminidase C-terminal domain-containing protein [Ruminiclostridium sp.]